MAVVPNVAKGNNALRKGDFVASICKGRISGPYITSCKTTFINGQLAIKLFNRAFPGTLITGSSKVFIEGLPAGRIRDKVICGINTTGSLTVYHG